MRTIATYNKDSIQKLDPLSFTRLRPDTYCGSTADSTQLVTEIVSNAVDEHLAGNGNKISVDITPENNVITVQDWGQGIIPNNKQDGKTTLEMVYGDINSSGKFNKSDDAVYKVSTGAFGIGAALTCFLSHYLIATTKRDGQYETVYFIEGKFDHREVGKCDKKEHGVRVEFQPSEKFFDSPVPNIDTLLDNAQKITCVCPKLTYVFNGQVVTNPNGLKDYVHRYLKIKPIIDTDFLLDETIDYRRLNLIMSVSDSGGDFEAFCNYSPIEAGTPITTIKSCITRTLNKWGQDRGLLKSKDTLAGSLLQEGMTVVFNLVSKDIRYDSQTKVRVTSTSDNPFINKVISSQLELWLDNNPEDGKIIIERAIIARRASEAAKKAREAVKQRATEKKDKVFKLPTKLTDCWGKDRSKCELLIAEGVSAASGLVAARDSEFQAVYGVRGKMLNVRKTAAKNVMKNQEINNIVVALGLDYNPVTGKMKYDPSKLRYGKIIACADADFDGFSIENLLFNILWYLCPELILNGHVYSSEPPLFKVTTKRNEYVYIRDDVELQQYKAKHKNIASIGRLKGLGEMDSEELAHCLLDPTNRKVVQLDVIDRQATDSLFEDLYGKAVEPRVRFILEHSEEVEEN